MKVILTQNVPGLGDKLDVRDVADGHARNYLLPRGLAVPADRGATHQVEKLIEERERKRGKEQLKANHIADTLEGLELRLSARSGASGRLYGEITSHRIADELSSKLGIPISRRQITIPNPIRVLGRHSAEVKVGPALSRSIAVEVIPLDSDQQAQQTQVARSV